MSDRASRTTIQIGSYEVEGFMLPDGSYTMSQTQTAEIVGLKVQNVSDFLRSKSLKSLMGEGYTPQISEIEPDPGQVRGASRIRGLPLEVVSAYWVWQSYRGNKKALALTLALVTETLERRFDSAFGVERTESDRNVILIERNRQLEQALENVRVAFEIEAELERENRYFRQILEENGIDPYALPNNEEDE